MLVHFCHMCPCPKKDVFFSSSRRVLNVFGASKYTGRHDNSAALAIVQAGHAPKM